jgi:hypothetical protein
MHPAYRASSNPDENGSGRTDSSATVPCITVGSAVGRLPQPAPEAGQERSTSLAAPAAGDWPTTSATSAAWPST